MFNWHVRCDTETAIAVSSVYRLAAAPIVPGRPLSEKHRLSWGLFAIMSCEYQVKTFAQQHVFQIGVVEST